MDLKVKLIKIYPQLTDSDFSVDGPITLIDYADGKGVQIYKWEHTTLPKPTQEQLDGVQ